jgi:hypothetical protein
MYAYCTALQTRTKNKTQHPHTKGSNWPPKALVRSSVVGEVVECTGVEHSMATAALAATKHGDKNEAINLLMDEVKAREMEEDLLLQLTYGHTLPPQFWTLPRSQQRRCGELRKIMPHVAGASVVKAVLKFPDDRDVNRAASELMATEEEEAEDSERWSAQAAGAAAAAAAAARAAAAGVVSAFPLPSSSVPQPAVGFPAAAASSGGSGSSVSPLERTSSLTSSLSGGQSSEMLEAAGRWRAREVKKVGCPRVPVAVVDS